MTPPWQRLSSWRHGLSYFLSEKARHTHGVYVEAPVETLEGLSAAEAFRVAELQQRYQVRFETGLNAKTSLGNYEYLDILDRGWALTRRERPAGSRVIDVGCASFWYAAALQAFYRPLQLIGVEVEGYRRFKDGHTRIDHAHGYLRDLPNAEFRVADFAVWADVADVISAWFPFVTAGALLAWRLPLKFLQPERLFDAVRRNLSPDGVFVMVNHGPNEALLAGRACAAGGLRRLATLTDLGPFSAYRRQPPLLSVWHREDRIAG